VISKNEKDTTLSASCVLDSKTGDVILKMVNFSLDAKSIKVNLSTFNNIIPEAEMEVLAGSADAENTFENLRNVVPVKSTFIARKTFEYNAPAMSLTVIRIKTKK
jgi:alpha-L-arabinofuranosidase